jgi:hypothetical protein
MDPRPAQPRARQTIPHHKITHRIDARVFHSAINLLVLASLFVTAPRRGAASLPDKSGDSSADDYDWAVWTSTDDVSGGRPIAYAEAPASLQQLLADRVTPDPVSWPLLDVGMVRGRNAILLVDTGANQVDVDVAEQTVHLAPYEARYLPVPADVAVTPVPPLSAPVVSATERCLHPVPAPQQFIHGRVSR